jgi:hypothetical protein
MGIVWFAPSAATVRVTVPAVGPFEEPAGQIWSGETWWETERAAWPGPTARARIKAARRIVFLIVVMGPLLVEATFWSKRVFFVWRVP